MRVPVRLGAERHAWWIPDSSALSEWLDDQPWEEPHPPLVARVPGTDDRHFIEWLRGELRRSDVHEDHTGMVEINERCSTCRGALQRWLGTEDTTTRGLATALNQMARVRPRVFLVMLDGSDEPAEWLALLTELQQIDSKLDQPGPLAFILGVRGLGSPVALACRLDVGWPVVSLDDSREPTRWTGYVHERVAWHCGGRLDLAASVGQGCENLRMGDDADLESALDCHALTEFHAIEESFRARLTARPSIARHHVDLTIGQGLLGLESMGNRLAPWVARAVLLTRPEHADRRYLASLVVCRPLASRILGRCIELEARLRDELVPDVGVGQEDAAGRTADRLRANPKAVEHRLEPGGRVRTMDPREMVSLAVLLGASGMNKRRRHGLHELRLVRNALAHGSGASWEAVRLLVHFEDLLNEVPDHDRGPTSWPRT